MSRSFSRIVVDHWIADTPGPSGDDEFTVVVDAALREDIALTVLVVLSGPRVVRVTPTVAFALSLRDGDMVGEADLRAGIHAAGFEFNGADHLFYLPLHEQHALLARAEQPDTRRLTAADAAEFERFCADAPEDDLDDAFVEIDHWLVYGTFVGGELVAAASAYPWHDSLLADIGVLTLPGFRGRGLAKRAVRAIAADALGRGYEPQYRCQLDNLASVALAGSAGFARFGEWDVVRTASDRRAESPGA